MASQDKYQIQDLAERLAKAKGLQKREAQTFVRAFFDLILEALEEEKYVKIASFGTFKLIQVDPRESVDVNTGARILIESHPKITFTPDSKFKDDVNRPFAGFEPVDLDDDFDLGLLDRMPFAGVEQESIQQSDVNENEDSILSRDTELADGSPLPSPDTLTDQPSPEFNSQENSLMNPETEDNLNAEERIQPYGSETSVSDADKDVPSDTDIVSQVSAEADRAVTETEVAASSLAPEDNAAVSLSQEDTNAGSRENTQNELLEHEEGSILEQQAMVPESRTAEPEISAQAAPGKKKSRSGHGVLYFLLVLFLVIILGIVAYFKISGFSRVDGNAVSHDTIFVERHPSATAISAVQDADSAALTKDSANVASEQPETKPAATVQKETVAEPQPAVTMDNGSSQGTYSFRKKYRITGTASTYVVKEGESLRSIAGKIWGDRNMDTYITRHNNIKSPDLISIGMELNIPSLEEIEK